MLRSVLLLLLLANGAYYAWAQGLLLPLGLAPVQQREPERLARQIRPEAVRLVPADEAVKSEAPKTEPATVAATVAAKAPDCLQAAPLDDATTEAVRRVLASWPAASWTLEPLADSGRWIVYMGKYANADNVERKKAQLRQIGVAFEPLSAPDLEPGLSLGGFASEAEAQQQLERLAIRGVRTAHVVQERPAAHGQRLTLPAVNDALRPKLDDLRAALAGKPLRACR